MLCLGSGNAQDPSFPEPLPAVVEPANITGNWQFIPIPLPERNVTHILVSDKKDRLWIGTPGGVALYDGVEATAPSFLSSELEQPIFVNSLVELADETVLVGTINDSLWLWKNGVIEAVFGACPRSVGTCSRAEWAFAKSDDNRLFVASSSFAPRRTKEINALAARISEKITSVEVSASYLGFAGGKLVSVSNSGTVSQIDTATGKPERELDLDLEPRSFAHAVSFAPGQVVIATTSACLGLDLERGLAPIVLATGYCSSGMMQRDGTSWLSTSRLFRHDIQGWRKWEPEQSGATRASVIVEDGNSNVWVGASTGLWRYVDIAKDLEFSGERSSISSVVATDSGDAVVGLQSGEVWLVRRNLTRSSLLPRDITVPVSPYYRGALLAREVSGQLWVLNANGLFKIEASGRSLKVAPFPIRLDVTPRTPAALAVSATGKACVGLVWSNEVVCLVNGGWQTSATLLEDIGGSAVGAVAFTKDDTLIAAGVLSVKVIGANTEEFGPFPPVPFGSKHNFSAVTETPLIPGADIAASGGWGGTV